MGTARSGRRTVGTSLHQTDTGTACRPTVSRLGFSGWDTSSFVINRSTHGSTCLLMCVTRRNHSGGPRYYGVGYAKYPEHSGPDHKVKLLSCGRHWQGASRLPGALHGGAGCILARLGTWRRCSQVPSSGSVQAATTLLCIGWLLVRRRSIHKLLSRRSSSALIKPTSSAHEQQLQ